VFIAWLLTRWGTTPNHGWRNARVMAWCVLFVSCLSALIGTGLLTSIPQSVLFLLLGGWLGGSAALPRHERKQSLASTRPPGRPALDR
jgi:hypothetical protein